MPKVHWLVEIGQELNVRSRRPAGAACWTKTFVPMARTSRQAEEMNTVSSPQNVGQSCFTSSPNKVASRPLFKHHSIQLLQTISNMTEEYWSSSTMSEIFIPNDVAASFQALVAPPFPWIEPPQQRLFRRREFASGATCAAGGVHSGVCLPRNFGCGIGYFGPLGQGGSRKGQLLAFIA
ncbi:hypothetical protein DFH07DRAFT_781890 [Mycena maculata]|uniref:Uncharacterized protein n=1 Tax=Mycena maculata TaxID=230809 RepID=A0AAD7HVT7_9AGAR|nr:hypothetical protein DFH07DRAFT_781890 [Mycena maculata]